MKPYILLTFIMMMFTVCENNNISDPQAGDVDYRQEMRNFVQKISQYAKGMDDDFIIVPQNGQELITRDGETNGSPAVEYLVAIDGTGREDPFYGYNNDNESTPEDEKNYLIAFCDLCEQYGVEVLAIDYCSAQDKMDNSYQLNQAKGYISFAAPERALNVIPDYPLQPFNMNDTDIVTLKDAKNFLYLINPENYETKQDFILSVSETDYDLIIMDYFLNDQTFLQSEIAQLKTKHNGGKRLVLSYLSIGEAEDYRYYWQENWKTNPPDWLEEENPNWEGNYKVKYWDEAWQKIIFSNDDSYLKKIIDAGFDGIYLDIIDAFEYFEEKNE